jgi:hypothetical protein
MTGIPVDQIEDRCTDALLYLASEAFEDYQAAGASGLAQLLAPIFAAR